MSIFSAIAAHHLLSLGGKGLLAPARGEGGSAQGPAGQLPSVTHAPASTHSAWGSGCLGPALSAQREAHPPPGSGAGNSSGSSRLAYGTRDRQTDVTCQSPNHGADFWIPTAETIFAPLKCSIPYQVYAHFQVEKGPDYKSNRCTS